MQTCIEVLTQQVTLELFSHDSICCPGWASEVNFVEYARKKCRNHWERKKERGKEGGREGLRGEREGVKDEGWEWREWEEEAWEGWRVVRLTDVVPAASSTHSLHPFTWFLYFMPHILILTSTQGHCVGWQWAHLQGGEILAEIFERHPDRANIRTSPQHLSYDV